MNIDDLVVNMITSGFVVLFLWTVSIDSSLAGVTSRSKQKPYTASETNSENKTYGVIVDCGSSGTRANIFEWNSDLNYVEMLHDIDYLRSGEGKPITKKIKPGLSVWKDNPDAASEYMKPIMDFILENVPENELKSTSVYLMCTAGMRLLETEDQFNIVVDLFKDLEGYFKRFAHVSSSIISGASEGMYQWITVNSKLKKLAKRSKEPTYGLIEMGGASIQVTYELLPEMENNINRLLSVQNQLKALETFQNSIVEPKMSLELKEPKFKLHSTTFLGFGSNSVREAFVDYLIMKHKNIRYIRRQNSHINSLLNSVNDKKSRQRYQRSITLNDPCLPVGSVQVMRKPLRLLSITNKTIGFDIDDNEPTFKVLLVGDSNYSKCWWYMNGLLNRAKIEELNCNSNEPCAMTLLDTPFVPHKSLKFVGLGDFYYTTKQMMNLDGTYNRTKVLERTRSICSTSYSELLSLYPEANKFDANRILLECFKAIWMDVFLTVGLRMPLDNNTFETIGKIRGDGIDWTLGAVLDKSLTIERRAESSERETT